MPISVRLPQRVKQQLADYCISHKVTKSEAVKRALEGLFQDFDSHKSAYEVGKRFMGSDKRPGDVARHAKRLLRERFRGT